MMGTGYTPDPVPRSAPAQHADGILGQVQEISSKAEDYIETYTQVSDVADGSWYNRINAAAGSRGGGPAVNGSWSWSLNMG